MRDRRTLHELRCVFLQRARGLPVDADGHDRCAPPDAVSLYRLTLAPTVPTHTFANIPVALAAIRR